MPDFLCILPGDNQLNWVNSIMSFLIVLEMSYEHDEIPSVAALRRPVV